MKKINWILHGVAIAGITILGIYKIIPEKKVGYIDTLRIVKEYAGMKNAMAVLEQKSKEWKANQDTLMSELENIMQQYEKESNSLNQKEKKLKLEYIHQKRAELENYKEVIQRKMKEEEKKLTVEALTPIDAFIKDYGRENNYSIIFGATATGNILYADKATDLTDIIIKEINKQ